MKILIVGSGGREHALAWKISQSPHLSRLYIAPGNAGTACLRQNVSIGADDVPELVAFCTRERIDLVVVGQEVALAAGLVDALTEVGIRVFGPTRAAAEIETSKVFSKSFMHRHGIPTARFATFSSYAEASDYLNKIDYPIVIKTSGLAAGKGVLLPDTQQQAQKALKQIMVERAFGEAGDEIVIEERLTGEEVSLLAISDGYAVIPMLPAQDHKRLLDMDEGPNTGGMGAYAPAPVCPPDMVEKVRKNILQPTIDGMRNEGRLYCGVLYAGLMVQGEDVQVLEYNCRFGDPEAQVLLPLLDSDLIDLTNACIDGQLAQFKLAWKPGAAVTVVLASQGYPGKYPTGYPILGLQTEEENAYIFQAGTRFEEGRVVTSGGRVLNVTGWGDTLAQAIDLAYRVVDRVHFEGMQYRRDIGQRAMQKKSVGKPIQSAYTESGVDIDAGNRAVALMKDAVRSTYTPAVLSGVGTFGGLYDASQIKTLKDPVLVASTDGVGTKVRLAAETGRFESIGHDIVNHCINDILVQGARPLFFLDYFASSKVDPQMVSRIVAGISEACRNANCALLGGETAEMPDVYGPGEFDLAGTIVGLVERDRILPKPEKIQPGDLIIGLASNGPHTNGYSLIRKIFAGVPLDRNYPELGISLADALLEPHRSYLPVLAPVLDLVSGLVKALAHITGGGFIENIPRVLPDDMRARIHRESWPVPPLFRLIQNAGHIPDEEMFRVFNMGIGMIAVVAQEQAGEFQQAVSEPTWIIGELVGSHRAGETKEVIL